MDALAREWTDAVVTTAYVPASRPDVEHLLATSLERLLPGLTGEEPAPEAAREVGEALVAAGFIGPRSLSRTVEVLGGGLAGHATPARLSAVLGELAAGYAMALRERTLDQQETVKLALLRACEKVNHELRGSEGRFRELFSSSPVGIALTDGAGRMLETNPALDEITGGSTAGTLFELFHPADVPDLRAVHEDLVSGRRRRFRLRRRLRLMDEDGEPAWVHLTASALHDGEPGRRRYVVIVEDATELYLLGERLSHQSLHDPLTGLPNQQFFVSTLEGAVGRGDPGSAVTLLKLDLDGFAVINDGLGREAGDRLLCRVADRLRAVLASEKATVARFGADEFAVLIEHTADQPPDVAGLATEINDQLAEPAYLGDDGVAVSACIGVVEHRGPGDPAELLRAAETTLRRVKAGGQRQWGLFDVHRDAQERARCRDAAVMPGAWETGEVELEYQPLVRLADGTVAGLEPLLRWTRRDGGSVSHAGCLALAARTGLMLPLGEWLLRTACTWLRSWHPGHDGPVLDVPLTPQQADDPDLVATVRRVLEQTGVRPWTLRLGFPAGVLGADTGDAMDNARTLVGTGLGVALTECGGATDLPHLERLPITAVRLAEPLLRHLGPVPHAASLVARAVRELVPLAASRGAEVVVGGIQTRAQADWWRDVGAHVGHGPSYGRPAPPDVLAARLRHT
ncbi:MAG TPA: EAL domain-containing protein [Pseudonocardiaceae bacterium]